MQIESQMVYRSLGEVYQQTGDFGESDRWYRMAIEVKPYDVTSHLTYARLLAKNVRQFIYIYIYVYMGARCMSRPSTSLHHIRDFTNGK